MNEYDIDQERLKRRRAIAEAQIASSFQMPSQVQTRFLDLSPLANIAKAYFGGQEQGAVDTEEKALAGRQRQAIASALSDYTTATTPRAPTSENIIDEQANGGEGAPATISAPAYQPTQTDRQGAAFKLLGAAGGDPRDVAKMVVASAMKPQSGFGNVDPKDYTPESLSSFAKTGDYSVLRPRNKVDFVNGRAVDPYATTPGTEIPPAPTEIERELQAAGLVKGSPEWNAAMKARVEKNTTHAPGTTVNVSTEKKYGHEFASQIAKADVDMRDAALKAPQLAERANRVKEVLASGKVLTGTGADYRLALGKAMNLAGASDQEIVTNTETLATDLAANTLAAIKSSGLGSGTGFSNADRDFLEKAVGGKITLEAGTIDRLATLAHRAAEKAAERWSTRVSEIPQDALQGTGIKAEHITVAPLFGGKAKPKVSPETQKLLDQYAPIGAPGG